MGANYIFEAVAQAELSSPPFDELIIATSGRLTTDDIAWVERHNELRKLPRIEVWNDSWLERVLAERPALIAQFGLR